MESSSWSSARASRVGVARWCWQTRTSSDPATTSQASEFEGGSRASPAPPAVKALLFTNRPNTNERITPAYWTAVAETVSAVVLRLLATSRGRRRSGRARGRARTRKVAMGGRPPCARDRKFVHQPSAQQQCAERRAKKAPRRTISASTPHPQAYSSSKPPSPPRHPPSHRSPSPRYTHQRLGRSVCGR